jgi:hypothetical protein
MRVEIAKWLDDLLHPNGPTYGWKTLLPEADELLALMDGEPVAWMVPGQEGAWWFAAYGNRDDRPIEATLPLYLHPKPAAPEPTGSWEDPGIPPGMGRKLDAAMIEPVAPEREVLEKHLSDAYGRAFPDYAWTEAEMREKIKEWLWPLLYEAAVVDSPKYEEAPKDERDEAFRWADELLALVQPVAPEREAWLKLALKTAYELGRRGMAIDFDKEVDAILALETEG